MSSPTASTELLSSQTLITLSDTELSSEEPTSVPENQLQFNHPPSRAPCPTSLQQLIMSQQISIMEFSGTQDDAIQPMEFLKTISRSLMGLGAIPSDEQRVTMVGL